MQWLIIAALVLILLSIGQPHKRRKEFDDQEDIDTNDADAMDYWCRMDDKKDDKDDHLPNKW